MRDSGDKRQTRATGAGRCLGVVLCALFLAGTPLSARAAGDAAGLATTAGYGVGSVLGTVVYAPFKLAYAALGSLTGGIAWLVTGGDSEVAKGVIGPAVRGTYVITPETLQAPDFPRSVAFVGREATPVAVAESDWQLPAVAAAPARACNHGEEIATVYFESGRADLAPRGGEALDAAIAILGQCPNTRVDVQGFADSTGSADLNVELSRLRAKTVSGYLTSRGVSADRIDWQGYGDAQAGDGSDRARDRRVAVFLRDA